MSLDIKVLNKRRQLAVSTYSNSDHAHREIADRLLERLDYILLKPENIVIYSWQGFYEQECLSARYPNAIIKIVSTLAELQSIADNSIELVISNLALEWEESPKATLQEFARVLTKEGLLHFTTLGPDTAKELAISFNDQYRVHQQTDMHHIGDCLKSIGFSDPVVDMEKLTLAYDDLNDLFLDLKNTASTNCSLDQAKGLLTPRQFAKMRSQYKALKIDDYYPFTLEIIYGHAWKVDRSEVAISADKIKIKKG